MLVLSNGLLTLVNLLRVLQLFVNILFFFLGGRDLTWPGC